MLTADCLRGTYSHARDPNGFDSMAEKLRYIRDHDVVYCTAHPSLRAQLGVGYKTC